MRLLFLSILLIYHNFFPVIKSYAEYHCAERRNHNRELYKEYQYNQLMDNYDVKFYKLDLEASDSTTYLSGSVTVLVEVLKTPFNEIVLELSDNMTIDSILVDDIIADFVHQNDEIVISTDAAYETNSLVNIQIFYSGSGRNLAKYSGIYNQYSFQLNRYVTYTLSEPFYSKEWFPCKQVLTDKADSVFIFITTDSTLMAGSNGLLASVTNMPGNKVRYEWKSFYPVAYYLISLSVADYYDYSFYTGNNGSDDSVLVQNYIYNKQEYINNNIEDINKTGDLINLFSELFGPYPFAKEKYGHCVVPMGGGMEHQTMTSLGNFSFGLVAHELAHQWFGNNVTCGSWHDIWINEGFASYSEYLANQYLLSQDNADIWMLNAHDIVYMEATGSIYVPDELMDDPARIFNNRLSYKKGAAIIHMIRQELDNDSLFFGILQEFQSLFKDSVALGMDFKDLLEQRSGIDFTDFFNQWYFGEGYPELNVSWEYSDDTLSISSFQTTSSKVTPLFNTLTEYKIVLPKGDTSVFLRQKSNLDQYKLYMPLKVKSVRVDPENWLLMKINLQNIFNIDEKYSVYPNPGKDKILIHFNDPDTKYEIYVTDMLGKIVDNFESTRQVYEYYLDALPKGLYFLLIKAEDKLYSSKFVKI